MDMSIRFPGIELTLDNVWKSVRIFGYEITIYGILIAVGMLLGVAFVVLEAKRCNQNQNLYLDLIIAALIGGVIGARLYYVGFSWSLYKGNTMAFLDIRSGGMSIYGGILGGAIAAALFCAIRKLSFWRMADTACLGLLIGQIIGRWGNFFNRESFGEYADNVFAMQLPLSAVRSNEVTSAMRENLMTIDGVSYIQVQPVFLYESVLCLLLLLWLLGRRRKKLFQGEIFMRYLAGYGLIRFFTEWLRTDKLLIPGTGISVSLVVSAVLFLLFEFMVMVRRSMAKKREAARKRKREARFVEEEKAEEQYNDEWVVPEWQKLSSSSETEEKEQEAEELKAEELKAEEPEAEELKTENKAETE